MGNLLIDFTKELSVGNKQIELKIEQNGASRGGALIAAVADKFFKQIETNRNLINNNSKEDNDKFSCKLVTNNLPNTCIQTY